MRALILRPINDARITQTELQKREVDSILSPMIAVSGDDHELRTAILKTKKKYSGLIFTSRNALRHLPEDIDLTDVSPVYCVGDATADIARNMGFKDVLSANGNKSDLINLVCHHIETRTRPYSKNAPLLRFDRFRYLAQDKEEGLSKVLTTRGYAVDRLPVYDVMPTHGLNSSARAAFENKEITHILFFAPLTARIFVEYVQRHNLEHLCQDVTACCISWSARNALQPLIFEDIKIADQPRQDCLLDCVVPSGKDEDHAKLCA